MELCTCRESRFEIERLRHIDEKIFPKVLVNNPCPVVKKENAFEDTMFLIDLLKQAKEKEIKQKKVYWYLGNIFVVSQIKLLRMT